MATTNERNQPMPNVISARIDVTKVTKERLFEGKKGAKYLDIILIPTTNSKYDNDFMVVESVTKEERERGVKGPILGNAKILGSHEAPPQHRVNDKPGDKPEPESDVPF